MLGTPPAFILSQDQTLDKWYLNLRRELKSICRVLLLSLLFLLIKRNCTRSFFTLSSSIYLDFLCFVLSHLLFNFQGPLATRVSGLHRPLACGGITFYHNFRDLSIPFLNFFSTFLQKVFRVARSSRSSLKALDYYNKRKTICQHLF